MKQRMLILLLFVILHTTAGLAQGKIKLYRTPAGKIYTQAQKDSIIASGYGIAITEEQTVGDTVFTAIEVVARENSFVQRYKNKPLPPFSLKAMDGSIISSESLKGKAVMLNFWSVTCQPCILEMPQLNQLQQQHPEIIFLAPAPENAASIHKLLRKHSFNFTVLPDAGQLFAEWGIDGFPKNFFVDAQGIVREVKEGTPVLKERDKDGKLQVAVLHQYNPILENLKK